MQDKNFLQRLIGHLSPQVFRPVPEGLLYIFLQAIQREMGGICPWDEGLQCQKGFTQFWVPNCRVKACPGYRSPVGLVAYTSTSDITSSVDNNFNYSSLRYLTSDDFVPIGTFGAKFKIDFSPSTINVVIGDSWTIGCTVNGGVVGIATASPSNRGSYGPVSTSGIYIGDHDTTYTVTIIDYWGYVQNYNDALLQMCLATCDGIWVDFWGDYFGIKRLFGLTGFETDNDYKTRIMKEITRAKGTKAVLLDEATRYFKSNLTAITEYCEVFPAWPSREKGWDGINPGKNPDGTTGNWTNTDGTITKGTDRSGLMPFEFYINPPVQRSPSAKYAKDGTKLIIDGITLGLCYSFDGSTTFVQLDAGDDLFPAKTAGNACLFGSTSKFSGVYFDLATPGAGGTYVWEYWNGHSWTDFVAVSNLTSGFTASGWVWWKMPVDPTAWQSSDAVTGNIPNTGTKMFWVRVRILTTITTIPNETGISLSYAGATNRGHYCGTQYGNISIPITTGVYNPLKRDKNDCYIYRQGSWEKPLWETGLQEIIDRLKTAGTVAIINPK